MQLPPSSQISSPTAERAGVHHGLPGKAGVGTVVVDAQIDGARIGLGAGRQQLFGGHIHRRHGLGVKRGEGQQPLGQKGVLGRQIFIGVEPGFFAKAPEQAAQGCAAAHRVAVGPFVGQDQKVVAGIEKGGGFIQRHRGPPPLWRNSGS